MGNTDGFDLTHTHDDSFILHLQMKMFIYWLRYLHSFQSVHILLSNSVTRHSKPHKHTHISLKQYYAI